MNMYEAFKSLEGDFVRWQIFIKAIVDLYDDRQMENLALYPIGVLASRNEAKILNVLTSPVIQRALTLALHYDPTSATKESWAAAIRQAKLS